MTTLTNNRWLIAVDLDGTLVGEDLRVPERVEETLQAVQAAGHVVTLATGRMYRATRPWAERLHIHAPLICYQGALVRDDHRVIVHRSLPLEIAHEAVHFAADNGVHINVYVDDQLYVARRTPEAEFYRSLSSLPGRQATGNIEINEVGDLLAFLQKAPTKIVFVSDPELAAQWLAIATERWHKQAQVVRSHPRFVELTHRDASKGGALLDLADALGISRERTLAIGDNLNDLSMVLAAAVGVAMGNAVPELQEAADWIAPPVWEGGVADALEEFVLS